MLAALPGCWGDDGDPDPDAVDPRVAAISARIDTIPAEGATGVAVGTWPVLRVDPPIAAEALEAIELRCADEPLAVRIHRLADGRIALQPERRLPAERACRLAWTRAGVAESVAFSTFRASEAPGRALTVLHRRSAPGDVAPVPDDFWTIADASTPTGLRLDLPIALRTDLRDVIGGLRSELERADGWSPIGPIVLPLSDRLDADSIPRSAEASLDPLATIALVDVDPQSPRRGERWPFETIQRKDRTVIGLEEHVLMVLPARPLRAGGRYALLMRRGVRTKVGRSMIGPSVLRPILEAASTVASDATTPSAPGTSGASAAPIVQAAMAARLAPALATARAELAIPWTDDDLVYALVFTVRSLEGFEADPRALAADVGSLAGPRITIERVEPVRDPDRPLAALVHGRFATPVWRERRARGLARDAAGRPRVVGRDALRFVLALPRRATEQPAPLLIYQHGNPGSARAEVGGRRQDPYLEAGFAVVGFTDLWNRGKSPNISDRRQVVVRQVSDLVDSVRRDGVVPDDWLVTLGEQLALVEALPELAALDVLPLAAPDGRPEIDASLPFVYEGISQGAIHGQALVAYSERIRAASLVAGGARLAELALHQAASSMVKSLPFLFGDFRPIDLWVTLALFQTAIDRQDPHLHALRLHLGEDSFAPGGSPGGEARLAAHAPAQRPSLLVTAGFADGYVPNRASRSLAWALGPLPWLDAPEDGALLLPRAKAPLRGNLADGSTGAYTELVPYGSARAVAPGCLPEALPLPAELLGEGHFCAQLADESVRRRVEFLRSAIEAAPPTVIDPFGREP